MGAFGPECDKVCLGWAGGACLYGWEVSLQRGVPKRGCRHGTGGLGLGRPEDTDFQALGQVNASFSFHLTPRTVLIHEFFKNHLEWGLVNSGLFAKSDLRQVFGQPLN